MNNSKEVEKITNDLSMKWIAQTVNKAKNRYPEISPNDSTNSLFQFSFGHTFNFNSIKVNYGSKAFQN